MPDKVRRQNDQSPRASDREAPKQRGKDWDERLRLVGYARFVEVEWSGKDHPCWPLPKR